MAKAKANKRGTSKASGYEAAIVAYCRSRGYPEPEPEFRFHPSRKWRLDFAWPEEHLAVEVHGAVWNQGRHTRGKGFTEDREKMNEAALAGWCVLELTTQQITAGHLWDYLDRWFQQRG